MRDKIPAKIIKDYLQPCLDSGNHLLSLINDILDFTQEDFSIQLKMTITPINIRTLIKKIYKS